MNKTKLFVPPPPASFTLDEWYLHNRVKFRCVENQQQLADRILAESEIVRDKTKEAIKLNKNETDHHLEEKINDIKFKIKETKKIRYELIQQIEDTEFHMQRLMNTMTYIQTEGMKVCKKCILLREERLGIDRVHDHVEAELLKELQLIETILIMLKRVLEQAKEQIRIMRSAIYFIDRELEDKEHALKIDKHNILLDEKSKNLSIYHGLTSLASADITVEEWDGLSNKNYDTACKAKNGGVQLLTYINKLLLQSVEDLVEQYNIVNEAFRRRIEETKETKTKLELKHNETVRQINEMTRNITRLETALAEKEGFMALAHTRLGNRAQRQNVELCKDIVEVKLVNEVDDLHINVKSLQQMIIEAQASLRYLLKTQLQLEEDINIKTNTLKIDEVDCMTSRQTIQFREY